MSDSLLSVGFTQLWQLTSLIVVVGFLARTVFRNRPHVAMVLWLLVLVKCVTPPIVSAPFGLFCRTVEPEPIAEPVIDEQGPFAFFIKQQREPVQFEYLPVDEPMAMEMVVLDERPIEALSTRDWLLIAWAAGTALVVLIALTRVLLCLRRIKRTNVDAPVELVERLEQLRSKLGIRRRVSLMITTSAIGPAVLGLFRLRIVVPEVIARDGAEKLEPILAHELLHIRRGDLWVGLLALIAKGLWWFHPLMWWVSKQISRDTERACDEEVLAALGCRPADYARSLLRVLEQKNELKAMPAFPGVRPVEITSQRMERIMSLRQGSRSGGSWRRRLLFVLAAAVVLPGAVSSQDAKPLPQTKPPVEQKKQFLIKATIIEAPVADIPQAFRKLEDVTVVVQPPSAKLAQEHQDKLNKTRQLPQRSSGDPWADQLERLRKNPASPGFGFTIGPQVPPPYNPPTNAEVMRQFDGIVTSGILKDGAAHPESIGESILGMRLLGANQLKTALAKVTANRDAKILCAPNLICNEGQQGSLETASDDLISIAVTPTAKKTGIQLEYRVEVTQSTNDGGKTVRRSETSVTLTDGKALVQSGLRTDGREMVIIFEAEELKMAPAAPINETGGLISNQAVEAALARFDSTAKGTVEEPTGFVIGALIAEVEANAPMTFQKPIPTRTVTLTQRISGKTESSVTQQVGYSIERDSVVDWVRALGKSHEVQILSRPMIATLEGQAGEIQVGQAVPLVIEGTDPVEIKGTGFAGIQLSLTPTLNGGKTVVTGTLTRRSDPNPAAITNFAAIELSDDRAIVLRIKQDDSDMDLLLALDARKFKPPTPDTAMTVGEPAAPMAPAGVGIPAVYTTALIAEFDVDQNLDFAGSAPPKQMLPLLRLVGGEQLNETATLYELPVGEPTKLVQRMKEAGTIRVLSQPKITTPFNQKGTLIAEPVAGKTNKDQLSLIHISEPTRPY